MKQKSQRSPLLFKIPLTRIKLFIAKRVYGIIRCFLQSDYRIIKRKGIWYRIDLSEGIDLSLFILQSFQRHIINTRLFSLPDNATIFDVGANIGTMSLQFAKKYSQSKVYAFEAADSAYGRLLNNISLNPQLAHRVVPVHKYISDSNRPIKPGTLVYASWKLSRSKGNRHPIHGGIKQKVLCAECLSLDDFVESNKINQVDLIKIDTDGHEFKVLLGCQNILKTFRPIIIFEVGLYLLEENSLTFDDIYNYLSEMRYHLICDKSLKEIDLLNYYNYIPRCFTTDLLALPDEKMPI